MDVTNLKQVLKECNKSAKTGYKIASAQEKNLNKALASAQELSLIHIWRRNLRRIHRTEAVRRAVREENCRLRL